MARVEPAGPLGEVAGCADISACGRYRYSLERTWNPALRAVTFVMLNPSTADASYDDPTIRRCLGYARRWGYGSLCVVNLFAWRATDPKDLKRAVKPVGPENDRYLVHYAHRSAEIIVAWGAHGAYQDRGRKVLAMLAGLPVSHLGLTADGLPKHPLYLAGSAERTPWGHPPEPEGGRT